MAAFRPLVGTLLLACISACSVPQRYRVPSPSPTPVPGPSQPPAQTQPAPDPGVVEEPQPPPAPVVREPTLSPASRALVGQAQAQLASKNYAVAAGSIERALRIEPDNALLWIELGKVRQAEGNYLQAENMARKALSMTVNAPRARASAWTLIAESYRARGKNTEAREAEQRAASLRNG